MATVGVKGLRVMSSCFMYNVLHCHSERPAVSRQSVRVQWRLGRSRSTLGRGHRPVVCLSAHQSVTDLHQSRQPRGPRHESQVVFSSPHTTRN